MYCVYWFNDKIGFPDCQIWDDLTDALKFCELQRVAGYKFVTMAIENPNMVGKMGVADVDDNYDWVKRRDAISSRKKDL